MFTCDAHVIGCSYLVQCGDQRNQLIGQDYKVDESNKHDIPVTAECRLLGRASADAVCYIIICDVPRCKDCILMQGGNVAIDNEAATKAPPECLWAIAGLQAAVFSNHNCLTRLLFHKNQLDTAQLIPYQADALQCKQEHVTNLSSPTITSHLYCNQVT